MSDARKRAEEALREWGIENERPNSERRQMALYGCAKALRALLAEQGAGGALHFVCTDFPGPRDECVFVECEDDTGRSINAGEWRRRPDGLVELVVSPAPLAPPPAPEAPRPAFTLTRDEAVAAGVPIHPDAVAVNVYGGSQFPPAPHGSTSTVRSDATPAKPLPTCVNCGSNFIVPAPSSAVREAAERLRSTRDFDPFDETGRLGPDADALLAALAARGALCPSCGRTGRGCACTVEERDAAREVEEAMTVYCDVCGVDRRRECIDMANGDPAMYPHPERARIALARGGGA